MVVGLPWDKGDQSDGKHFFSVSLTLSCIFSGSYRHFLGGWLACGSGGPWIRSTDNGEGKRTNPQASRILPKARQWKVHHFV
jgi:hypothetical protein